ncbi:MAG: hypothetical protein CME64_00920 [Halobacteriovoraceae bacterium]|nr:hypothetical protein [Halobacteriovoraceae bacterium]
MKLIKTLCFTVSVSMLIACNQQVEDSVKTVYKNQPHNPRSKNTFLVTEKYGALTVKEGVFSGESKIRPWSAWWYPINETTLFRNSDSQSTLEKLDYYSKMLFEQYTQAARFEEQKLYRPNEVGWAGLCHAWAIASVLHPEPTVEKLLGGVRLSTGDQKALLLKSYEKATGIANIMYGERYTGSRGDDYDDIYPDQFHRLVQHHVIENKKPFLMDYDPRHPVWTVPAYKVKFIIEKNDETSALVSAWITFASPHVDVQFVGTKRIVKGYKYLLKGNWSNGVLTVKSGEWIEESKNDHPDYLISFPDSIERGSRNPEIKTEIVDSIVK